MGSKDAIAQFPLAILNPGDLAHRAGAGLSDVQHRPRVRRGGDLPGAAAGQNGFLLDFDAIPPEVCRQAKLLWLNYPNNPTTAVADLDFFGRAVEFGRRHDILICPRHRLQREHLRRLQGPQHPPGRGGRRGGGGVLLAVQGFSMTGWRAGCMVGNASAVTALRPVKENIDNGTLRAIQFAAAKALDCCRAACPADQRGLSAPARPGRRRPEAHGWSLAAAQGDDLRLGAGAGEIQRLQRGLRHGPAGEGRRGGDARAGYGQWGEGYFRISLTYPDEVLKEALGRIMEMRL